MADKKQKIIAIIPARGGSKGLPGKNIKVLSGKPLIAWTIEQARKSKYIDKLIVSTDDKEIARISEKYGANVPFLRPKKLAKDNSSTLDAIVHAISWFERNGECFDIIVLLEPTSPLRKKNDIDDAIGLFIKNYKKADSLLSLGAIQLEKPQITKKIEKGFVAPFVKTKYAFHQRQQLAKAYFPYGVVYIVKTNALKKTGTFYTKKTIPYFIERWQNYEIDDICDFICNEAIMENKLNNKLI
ncbi:MAG: acylneuraminate cytidylyltransferase family protein [Minisyncoccales bacterium]